MDIFSIDIFSIPILVLLAIAIATMIAVYAGIRSGSSRSRSGHVSFALQVGALTGLVAGGTGAFIVWGQLRAMTASERSRSQGVVSRADGQHTKDEAVSSTPRQQSWQEYLGGVTLDAIAAMGQGFVVALMIGAPLAAVGLLTRCITIRKLGAQLQAGHCFGCGYDLTGNVSGRCPECGKDVPH